MFNYDLSSTNKTSVPGTSSDPSMQCQYVLLLTLQLMRKDSCAKEGYADDEKYTRSQRVHLFARHARPA